MQMSVIVRKRITVQGKLSLRCKQPVCIGLDHHQLVYLFGTKSESYYEMEDKLVAVTGILRFYKSPPAEPTDRPVGRLPDCFYFGGKPPK